VAEPLKVYWSPYSVFADMYFMQRLADVSPTPLLPELMQERSEQKENSMPGYHSCGALHAKYKNTFTVNNPVHTRAVFNEIGYAEKSEHQALFSTLPSSFKDRMAFGYEFNWLFFSEEPLIMEVTPPYMHKTLAQNHGVLASGEFDISSWFRPTVLMYHLWKGISNFEMAEDEPMAYLTFKTERPVELVPFQMTEKLQVIAKTCLAYKEIRPRTPLNHLYNQFKKTNMDKVVIKEIKANIV
jgi:hypothetical protein